MRRRLIAILFADIVGYGELCRRDEAGTRAEFKRRLRVSIRPAILRCKGRLIEEVGDSLLAEFDSAVNAVRCAAAIQEKMVADNQDMPAEGQLHFRVGVRVTAGTTGGCEGARDVWSGELPVAQVGRPYNLPMPKALVFGKLAFGVSFAESGALTSVQYTSNTGLGQALNVTSAAVTAAQGETAAKAAALKAEADVIAEQQRLARCLADQACQ